jgi:hypothetical protein
MFLALYSPFCLVVDVFVDAILLFIHFHFTLDGTKREPKKGQQKTLTAG